MSYQIKFSGSTRVLTVEDQSLNQDTSIDFVGKQYLNYAPVIAEGILHLLENFASSSPPTRPVTGQLWYDSNVSANYLKVYNGTNWTETGFIKKSNAPPSNPTLGDLWVDTLNNIVKLYTGNTDPSSEWVDVGPSLGTTVTGLVINVIEDNQEVPSVHNIICFYVDEVIIAIISNDTFVPKIVIPGFNNIVRGLTLNNDVELYGTATSANSLIEVIDGNKVVIQSSDLLRRGKTNTVDLPFQINNAAGLLVGDSFEFQISTSDADVSLIASDKNIKLGCKENSVDTTVICISADKKVGVGQNNILPEEALDVLGNAKVRGTLEAESVVVDGKVLSNQVLPGVFASNEYNALGKYIGHVEQSPVFLTGVWLGTAVGLSQNSSAISTLETVVMVVTEFNAVNITGWRASITGILTPFNQPEFNEENETYSFLQPDGVLTRIRPFMYFYATSSVISGVSGCMLQTMIVSRSGDTGSLSLLSKTGCPSIEQSGPEFNLKTYNLYKVSDDSDDFSGIYTDLNQIYGQW